MKSWLKYFVLIFCLKFIDGSQSFRCDYEYSSAAKGWFKHFTVPATWVDAQLRCTLEGAVLASPTIPEIKDEMIYIINFTRTGRQYEVFRANDTLSKGAYHTVEGSPLSNISQTPAANELDNKENEKQCPTLNSNGDLAEASCEETRPFICYRSESNQVEVNECGTVDPEYHLDKRTDKCYKLHKVPQVFSRALLECTAEGGHLAIINSFIESRVLGDIFSNYPESSMVGTDHTDIVLIGFYYSKEHGDWRTIHGQSLAEAGYSQFQVGEPNNASDIQFCGAMYRSGELDDMFCDYEADFICEKSSKYSAACSLPDLSSVIQEVENL